jgi:tRNA(Leu) C34 or U34 (ribose-2'-O)-methylase TrmL
VGAADSATDMFMDGIDYATPVEFSSFHLRVQESADYTTNERAVLLQGEGKDENPIEYATPSYLMFSRESRTVDDVTHDAQSIVIS